jgi:hypothetical protein
VVARAGPRRHRRPDAVLADPSYLGRISYGIEQLADRDRRVKAISLDDAVCPNLPSCDPVVDGVITRIDNDHLTVAFANSLEPVLDARLTAAGVFG